MLANFDAVKQHLKFNPKKVSIDNIVFKLHYRATFIILLVCTILVTSRQYIGEHIRCITFKDGPIPDNVINTFCFFTTTYTVVRHMNDSLVSQGVIPHPGVGPVTDDEPTTRHAYYQWVPFVLFGQAIMFYFPHYLWKTAEAGRIKALVNGLQMIALSRNAEKSVVAGDTTVPSKSETDGKVNSVKLAFLSRLHVNRPWSTWLIGCELLNFINVFVQVYITDQFLGGLFWDLGPQVISSNFDSFVDPLDVVFPKVTKCDFFKYGASGSIQKHDALCVMALNVINEKIYTFLWFWFLFLSIASLLGLIWRVSTLFLHSRSARFNNALFSQMCPGNLNPWTMLEVTRQFYFSDWLFLYYLAKNMDGFAFRDLFLTLAAELDDQTFAHADEIDDGTMKLHDLDEIKRSESIIDFEETPLNKKD